jgi:methyl-accepting chemotaxis protein
MIATPDALDEQLMTSVKTLATANAKETKLLRDLNETISKKNFQGELDAVAKATALQRLFTIFLFAIAIAFAIFATVLLQRQIGVPLKQAVSVLEEVADGDLTVSLNVETGDEVGQMATALNRAVERLNGTMQEVAESAANANSSSQQLAAASEAIAAGAQKQAASLEETSASLEQITAAVRQSADNAQQANQLANGSKDSAVQGQEVVSKAIAAMSEINVASAKISEIISTIDEIAFQTNLLAVNAAVEAARAGDEGRGFAVVAAEVRSLAQRSALAAKEIKGLIQDTLRKVDAGTTLVNRSGETLHGIVGSIKRVSDIVGEIAASSAEQSTGIEQVNNAMTQMDQVTQSNSAQTEELSATAQTLSDQSARLLELVGTFTLSNSGGHSKGPAFQPRVAGPIPSVGASLANSTTTTLVHSAPNPPATAKRSAKVALSKGSARSDARPRARKSSVSLPMVVTAPSALGGSDDSFQEF